jgi:hypothetical protein
VLMNSYRAIKVVFTFLPRLLKQNYSLSFKNISCNGSVIDSFIRLPVLDTMVDKFSAIEQSPLNQTAVVYVHHSLRTSLNLLDSMFSLGLAPQNTFVLGKHYSENSWVVQEATRRGVHYQPCSAQVELGRFEESFMRDINSLWVEVVKQLEKRANIENVLILDHGGYAINLMPASISQNFKVVGLEKTSGGLINWVRQGRAPSFPLINMANCATKRVLESPFIAEAVVDKLSPVIPVSREPRTCGVIGYGTIGKAIAEKLFSLGHRVIIYDTDSVQLKTARLRKNFLATPDLTSLMASADLLFGCSGQDITRSVEVFRLSPRDKTLVSCSSGDREFLTLLQLIQTNNQSGLVTNPLQDVIYGSEFGGKIEILRGGFPYNFDDSGESVPANEIQLTRALVLAGVLQAIDFFRNPHVLSKGGLYALDAELQKFVVHEWLQYQPTNRYSEEVLLNFGLIDWIKANSSGIQERLSFTLESPFPPLTREIRH